MPVPDDPAAVASWFLRSVEAEPAAAPTSLPACATPKPALSAHRCSPARGGGWGLITAVVGLDPATRSFRQIRFLEQNETPGLGARITEAWFQWADRR